MMIIVTADYSSAFVVQPHKPAFSTKKHIDTVGGKRGISMARRGMSRDEDIEAVADLLMGREVRPLGLQSTYLVLSRTIPRTLRYGVNS